ncbi:MAG: hypothetical protein IJC51_02115 [Eggerthellaceae bacterium]|nr:hypothetical protein [Eggerthellaceae bacterium]
MLDAIDALPPAFGVLLLPEPNAQPAASNVLFCASWSAGGVQRIAGCRRRAGG